MSTHPTHLRRLAVCLVALVVPAVTGCGSPSQTPPTAASSAAAAPATVTVTDLLNRSVSVPTRIGRILALHPIPGFILWRLAPDRTVSVDTVFADRFLKAGRPDYFTDADRQNLQKLPVTGVYFKGLNPEQLLSLRPDAVITMKGDPEIDKRQQQLGIPMIAVSKAPLVTYEDTIRLIGTVVNNKADADQLAGFYQNVISQVEAKTNGLPAGKRPTVLYTGAGGNILTTPGKDTVFGSIIDSAGGRNVGDQISTGTTNETIGIGIEQVLKWNPDVIIATTVDARDKILNDPSWQSVAAVQNKKVYVPPQFGSLDGIQSIVGLAWTEGILAEQNSAAFQASYAATLKQFYALFFKKDLTPAEITEPATQ